MSPRLCLFLAGLGLVLAGPASAQSGPRIGPYFAPDPNAVVRPVDPALKDWYAQRGSPTVKPPPSKNSSRVYRGPPRKVYGPQPYRPD